MKLLILFFVSIIISSCGLMDRKGAGDVADLEPIPEETTQEQSILIEIERQK